MKIPGTSILVTIAMMSFVAPARTQEGQEYFKRLKPPAVTKGFIGGESHDSYVVRGKVGRVMTVRISWKPENEMGPNHAEFYVSTLSEFGGDGLVKFGKELNDGKRWVGRIPKTRDYYIYVMAHPTAHYTLRVTVK